MEIYINALLMALSPQVVFALLGGLIGVGIKSRIEGYNWGYTIFISIGSLIAVGATAEYLYSVHNLTSIFVHMFIAVIIGIIGASILHSFNLFAPILASKIVETTGNKLSDTLGDKLDKYLD